MHAKKNTCPALSTPQKVKSIADWLLDKKAVDILALDLAKETGPSEAVIIVTATSARHGQNLADHVLKFARSENFEYLGMEGFAVGQWILVDLNDVIVHIFQSESRAFFQLDALWPRAGVLADTRKEP